MFISRRKARKPKPIIWICSQCKQDIPEGFDAWSIATRRPICGGGCDNPEVERARTYM